MILLKHPLPAALACGLLLCTTAAVAEPGKMGMDMFNKIDANGDGRISAAEHDAHARTMFTTADANRDGAVTADEMRDAMRTHMGMRMGMRDGADHMRKADTDRDGRISRAEFTTAHDGDATRFAAHDGNNDGFISTDEMKQHKMGMRESKKGCCEDGCACCDKMKKAG